MGRRGLLAVVGVSACLLSWACEPASITEARDQLRRGGERVTRITLPVAEDSVLLDVGGRLRFNNLNLTALKVNIPGGSLVGAGTVSFNVSYAVLSGEPRIMAIDTIVAESGSLTITTLNRLPAALNYTLTLNGLRNAAGAVVTQSATVPASPNDGSYSSSTVQIDLAGVTIAPAAVDAGMAGSITLNGPVNPAYGDSAFIQTGTGSIVVRSLTGPLDPAVTPELTVSLQDSTKLPELTTDFGDLAKEVSVDSGRAILTVINSMQTPLALSGFRMGVVQLDAEGNLVRDGGGNLVYENDASGNPIFVSVVDPGQATFSIARAGTGTVSLPAGPFLDRLVDLLLDNKGTAVVLSGSAIAGDQGQSRITRADSVKVRLRFLASISITVASASPAPPAFLAGRWPWREPAGSPFGPPLTGAGNATGRGP